MGKLLKRFYVHIMYTLTWYYVIQCDGKEISWSHLVNLYWRNRSQETPGLALLPKLKYEHIELSSYSKMRVDLAAQVNEHT